MLKTGASIPSTTPQWNTMTIFYFPHSNLNYPFQLLPEKHTINKRVNPQQPHIHTHTFGGDVHIKISKCSSFCPKNRPLCLHFQPHVTDSEATFKLQLLLESSSHPSCDLLPRLRDAGRSLLFYFCFFTVTQRRCTPDLKPTQPSTKYKEG